MPVAGRGRWWEYPLLVFLGFWVGEYAHVLVPWLVPIGLAAYGFFVRPLVRQWANNLAHPQLD